FACSSARCVSLMLRRPRPFAVLFFSSSAELLHLHSFPTRRSSDLAAMCVPFIEEMFFRGIVLGILLRTGRKLLSTSPEQYAQDEDRKSTRLNSSHLVISYAVFCLKKKKKKTRR